MITREWIDRVLPRGPALMEAASREIGSTLSDDILLGVGLRWLAEVTEQDRFPRPAWTSETFDTAWPITANGLKYKSESQYLTAQGWPLGTRCWFVTIECGWREHVFAEDPETALLRAICVVGAARRWRDTNPKQRLPFLNTVEREFADLN